MSTFPRNPKAAPEKPTQPRYGRMDVGLGQVSAGIARATDWLLGQQHADGYWCGELEADSMLESDYIFMHTLLGTGDRGKMESVRGQVDHADIRQPGEHQLHRECGEQEAEHLLGHQHPARIQVAADVSGPAEHRHVDGEH